jgi:hypothetical protein
LSRLEGLGAVALLDASRSVVADSLVVVFKAIKEADSDDSSGGEFAMVCGFVQEWIVAFVCFDVTDC